MSMPITNFRRVEPSASLWTSFRVMGCTLIISLLVAVTGLIAQDKNPYAGDPKAAKAGESQFRANCAFCHGLGARGGGRGPDLTRAQKRHGNGDADLFRTINEGVPGTAMPPNGATQQGVGMTEEEIWQVISYIRSVQVKAPVQPMGNAAHGKELFYGSASCSTCHMVQGKGGRLGPDLSTTGSARSTSYLVESIREPSRRLAQGISEAMKEFSQEYETVKVETADGQKFMGVVLNEDHFTLQMMDTRENLRLFEKDKLKSFEKTRESLMPAYDQKTLSDKEMQDILAYLLEVGAQ
ncbi:MAG TPA: c-type cytochrome [Candidatus Udaeobacter sp.]|jgi:cytochrome c oxidase cbb3-type subunit III|nr:c-type cytochrome [Candidatus Udaeobacter sp.]